MSRIAPSNTGPEIMVRSLLHRAGFRFSLRRRDLPGKPDIVLPKYGAVVFVHGCFWHRHGCSNSTMPKTSVLFWKAKFSANRKRDRKAVRDLRALGWHVITVWECELDDKALVAKRLIKDLKSGGINGRSSH
jgi:DNA mismatch endonuclease (patch repair protein)